MSKRTNKLYNVQVVRYAWIAVEADSAKEAMELAHNTDLEEYIENEQFEESEIDVYACETYSQGVEDMYLEDDEYILTKDGNMKKEDYIKAMEEEL